MKHDFLVLFFMMLVSSIVIFLTWEIVVGLLL